MFRATLVTVFELGTHLKKLFEFCLFPQNSDFSLQTKFNLTNLTLALLNLFHHFNSRSLFIWHGQHSCIIQTCTGHRCTAISVCSKMVIHNTYPQEAFQNSKRFFENIFQHFNIFWTFNFFWSYFFFCTHWNSKSLLLIWNSKVFYTFLPLHTGIDMQEL